ncbi:MAG: hypothetical protein V4727_11730 [Verrucomicrobiota bacterium]
MKKAIKWLLIITGSAIAILIITVIVIILAICKTPKVEPISSAYLNAKQIWSADSETKIEEVELNVDGQRAKIYVTEIPTVGTNIQYPDEHDQREIFPYELYFGATEVRYDEAADIIYVKVRGSNAITGRPHGERIFEYDARKRSPVRDYWVHVSE